MKPETNSIAANEKPVFSTVSIDSIATSAQNARTHSEADEEIWKPIPNLEFYEASNFGRIRSLDCHREFVGRWGGIVKRWHHGRILRLKKKDNGCGGIYLNFYYEGKYPQVNRIVCETFNGPPPTPKHEAAHLDGDTLNNRPENLVWATAIENAAHKKIHGTDPVGSKNGTAVLNESDIPKIFDEFINGKTTKQIGEEYKISQSNASQIIRRKTWSHVFISPDKVSLAKEIAKKNILDQGWKNIKDHQWKATRESDGALFDDLAAKDAMVEVAA